ncbi:HAD-IC family P-type ATPase [Verrucomicrobium spinosum]|uniref:HAD-IC family P-type ATPase n=1 Tax=Verrucomicrobium spinosum TaxID=2736 RepID=UPI000946827B|nr:HAD-IC family P-type ATPase [Verrucomicrobium spinosum]
MARARPEEACSTLNTSAATGLTAEELQRRRAEWGANTLPEVKHRPFWRLFLRQFASPLIYILFVAAAISASIGHGTDAGVILFVVMANALIGTFQEGRAEHSMSSLQQLSALTSRVIREGKECVIEARDLVPGDILLLAAGDAVGADARLLEVAALEVSEAALTGESLPVAKQTAPLPRATGLADRTNMVSSATHVTAGRARAWSSPPGSTPRWARSRT